MQSHILLAYFSGEDPDQLTPAKDPCRANYRAAYLDPALLYEHIYFATVFKCYHLSTEHFQCWIELIEKRYMLFF